MEANTNYRDPDKPAFATVNFKGGGDAAAAARAVLETGEYDYAWNLQLAPDVLDGDGRRRRKGKVVVAFGTLGRADRDEPDRSRRRTCRMASVRPPSTRTRSSSDKRVREALSMAIDRDLLVEVGYGQAGKPTCNLVPGAGSLCLTDNTGCLKQDIEGAKKLLDEAGWKPGPDGIRVKDGKRLSLIYQTSTNAVRQDFQALIKQWWKEIGVEIELQEHRRLGVLRRRPGQPGHVPEVLCRRRDVRQQLHRHRSRRPTWRSTPATRLRGPRPSGRARTSTATATRSMTS